MNQSSSDRALDAQRERIAIATRLTAARQAQNLTLAAVARRMEVTTACVWNWEKGKSLPRPEAFKKLARMLGVSVQHLMGGNGSIVSMPALIDPSNDSEFITQVIEEARMKVARALKIETKAVRILVDLTIEPVPAMSGPPL